MKYIVFVLFIHRILINSYYIILVSTDDDDESKLFQLTYNSLRNKIKTLKQRNYKIKWNK